MTKKLIIFFTTICLFLLLPLKGTPPPPTPMIVAEVTQLQDHGNLPLTTLFSPTAEGNYRVSLYFATTTPPPTGGTSSTWMFSWTDELGQRQQTSPPQSCPSITNPSTADFCIITFPIIHCVANTAITFQNTFSDPTIASYDLFYVVEKV